MPIYGYRCENGHDFEVFQSMVDHPVDACEQCGAPVERVFHPIAVHFKGSGFYTTDYARKGSAEDGASKAKGGEPSRSKGDSAAEPKAGSKDSGSGSKPAEKPSGKSSADD